MTSATAGNAPGNSSSAAAAPRRHRRRRWLRIGLPVVLALIAGSALWVWGSLAFVYSSGERTGYVRRLTQEGWLCKTWEGALAVSPVPGTTPQKNEFAFTIKSDSLARALELLAGKQVTLSYAEHKGVPTSCFGETEYYVQGFRTLP